MVETIKKAGINKAHRQKVHYFANLKISHSPYYAGRYKRIELVAQVILKLELSFHKE